MRRTVLLLYLLLGVVSSSQPPSQQSEVTQDQVWAELFRYLESTVRSSVAEVAKRLDTMEASLTERQDTIHRELRTLSDRLNSVQQSLSVRLDSVQQSQAAISGEQNTTQQDVATLSDRLDIIQKSLSARLNSVQQSMSDRLDSVQQSLSDRLDSVQQSLSDRLDSVQQSQAAISGEQNTTQQDVATLSDRLDIKQQSLTAPRHTPGRVLGESCRADGDCRDLVTDSVCSASGVCACADGFQEVADATCRPFPRLAEECRRDADCRGATPHAVCSGRVCSCPADFWNRDDAECRPGVAEGQPCRYDGDCSVQLANFTCTNGRCTIRMCGIVSVKRAHKNQMWSYRLTGGTSCDNGLVLAERDWVDDDKWNAFVCDDDWTAEDARVVCRSLGFASGAPRRPSWHGKVSVYWLRKSYACVGTENSLMSCRHEGMRSLSNGCPVSELAAVTCQSG